MNEKQYLEADLETLRGMVFLPEHMNTIEYVGEILERAIAAEEELNETYIDENGAVWNRPTAWAYYVVCKAKNKWQEQAEKAADRIAILTEENDLQRQAIQNLSAQVVGLTDCLLSFPFKQHNPECGCPECQWLGKREKLLKEPDPGAEIRERLAKLEKVAEAAQAVCGLGWTDNYSTMVPLKQALASLKGGRE